MNAWRERRGTYSEKELIFGRWLDELEARGVVLAAVIVCFVFANRAAGSGGD